MTDRRCRACGKRLVVGVHPNYFIGLQVMTTEETMMFCDEHGELIEQFVRELIEKTPAEWTTKSADVSN